MIIDSHTHIGKKTIVASADDLVRSMDQAHIDKSLVLAGKINEQATEILLNDIAPHNGRLYGIGSISPTNLTEPPDIKLAPEQISTIYSRTLAYIESCFQDHKIYGLKFYPGYEWFYPQDAVLRGFLELCVKYDKPAIFHSGDCFNGVCGAKLKYAHPLHFDELAVEMPNLKIIIAHMGYPWIRDAAEVCYKNKNVYADTSGFVYGKFTSKDFINYKNVLKEFITIAGDTEKLIFGTDWPISLQDSYVKNLIDVLWELEVPPSCQKEIMGTRTVKLFGID